MNEVKNHFAVFVKPWKTLSLPELARHIRKLGFEWIELPVRPGFPCELETIEKLLPKAVRILGEEGVKVWKMHTGQCNGNASLGERLSASAGGCYMGSGA